MINKKTVIGIIIIAAILILTPYYQKLVMGEPEEVPAGASDTSSAAPSDVTETGEAEAEDDESVPSPEIYADPDTLPDSPQLSGKDRMAVPDTIPEEKVYVRTEKFDIVLTNDGGDIESIVSREFDDTGGDPLEYVPQEISGDNLPVVGYRGSEVISSSGLSFVTDEDTLILDQAHPEDTVNFVASLPGGGILERSYVFRFDDYRIHHRAIFSGGGYERLDESLLWWRKGLEPSAPNLKRNVAGSYRIGYMMGGDYEDEKFGSGEKPQLSKEGTTHFVATLNKYFAVIIAPEEGTAAGIRADGVWYNSDRFEEGKHAIPALGVGLVRRGGPTPVERRDVIYFGPRDHKILSEYARDFEEVVDLGWSWISPLTRFFITIFAFLQKILGNYGLVIIVFSILIKLVLLPLSKKQLENMKKMKELQPRLSELKEKYKDDVKKLNEETMKLYQREKINPLGGCLPLLPQMPIFFALFSMLRNSFAIRGEPFVLWIQDLSVQDPYYVLPILMAGTMFLQQKLTVKDPKQKMMVYFMPLIFLFFFRNMPAGLVLYWLCFNLFSLAQTLWVERKSSGPEASTLPAGETHITADE